MALPTITMTGTLVADPDYRVTPGGKPVASFRVATNKKRKNDAGKWEDVESCFLSCTVWDQDADAVAAELFKGTQVTVVGALKQRDYVHEGNKRTAFEVDAYSVAKVVKMRTAEREKPAATPAVNDPWAKETAPPAPVDPWAEKTTAEIPY